VVPAEVSEQKINDLRPVFHLEPGELRIKFDGAEELLRQRGMDMGCLIIVG